MKRMMVFLMFAAMMFGTLATANAEQGDWRGGIRSRIQEARQKINKGIERGTLDRREAGRLNKELGNILNKIERMKEDGRLSLREREKINRNLDSRFPILESSALINLPKSAFLSSRWSESFAISGLTHLHTNRS